MVQKRRTNLKGGSILDLQKTSLNRKRLLSPNFLSFLINVGR